MLNYKRFFLILTIYAKKYKKRKDILYLKGEMEAAIGYSRIQKEKLARISVYLVISLIL